jgi:hypothetical protein
MRQPQYYLQKQLKKLLRYNNPRCWSYKQRTDWNPLTNHATEEETTSAFSLCVYQEAEPINNTLVPVFVKSKAIAGVAGSNSAAYVHVRLLCLSCFVYVAAYETS